MKLAKSASIVWLGLLVLLALGATAAAAWQGQALGWPAFLLLFGVAAVCLFGVLAILFRKVPKGQDGFDDGSTYQTLLAGFQAIDLPSVIVKDGKPVLANAAYHQLAITLGVGSHDAAPADELPAEPAAPPSVERLFSRNEKAASAAIYRLHHTSSESGPSEETIQTVSPDGQFRNLAVRVAAIPDGQIWQIQDLSGETEDAPGLMHNAPVGLCSVGPNGNVLETNQTLRGWIGMTAGTQPTHISEFIEDYQTLLDGDKTPGRTVRLDTRLVTEKGIVTPTVLSAMWHETNGQDIYGSLALYGHTGLGAARHTASAHSQTGAHAAMDDTAEGFIGAPFGIVHLDSRDVMGANIVRANSAFMKLTGQSDLSGRLFRGFFADDKKVDAVFRQGAGPRTAPVDVLLADNPDGGAGKPVNVYFSDTETEEDGAGCIAYIIDISAHKALEDQLIQSQKMQAIGQLAGGVAHDFNNLLQAIRLNTDDLLGRHPIGDPSYPELQKINQTVSRAAGLVRKLLAFSRKQTLRAQVLDVTEVLSDLSMLLKQVLVERVSLDMVHGRGLPPIQADKGQLETVLMNLCVNARDAMIEKGGGGTVTLRSSLPSAEDYAKDGIESAGAGYVLIEVSDTGTGMDAATQSKIFEPFFTTKEQGKGTGLGLATVYGIVEQSGGHLRVSSQLGKGTTFRIYMPVAGEDALSAAPAKKPEAIKPSDLAGQGNILFVEDEDAVRTIAAKTLRKRGYTVVEAGDGEEAYELLEEADKPFDLMISDVVMPGLDGPGLLKKARPLLGDARIVFISGYAEEEFSDLLAEEPDVTFLPKPFTLTQLAEKVKSVIGDAG